MIGVPYDMYGMPAKVFEFEWFLFVGGAEKRAHRRGIPELRQRHLTNKISTILTT